MSDADLDSFFSELKELAAETKAVAASESAAAAAAPTEVVAPPRDLLAEAAAEDAEEEASSALPPPPKASTSVFAPRSLKPNVLSRPAVISKPPVKAAPPPPAPTAPAPAPVAPPPHFLPPALYHAPPPMVHHGFHPAPPMAYYDIMAGGMGAATAAAAGGLVGGGAASAPYPPTSSASQHQQAPPPSKPSLKRSAAGETWVDPTLADWPTNDYRLFVANLGPEASEDILAAAFSKYRTFAKCRVVKPKIGQGGQGKVKPYGFVSFMDPWDALAALKEMDGAYIGSRPCSLRKSNWESRGVEGGGGGGKKPRT